MTPPAAATVSLALIVVLGSAALAGVAIGSAAAAPRLPQAARRPRIALVTQSTWITAHKDFALGVRISGAPADGNVRISVHRPVRDRAAFEDAVTSNEAGHELFNLDLLPVARQPVGSDGTRSVLVAIHTNQNKTTAQTEEAGVYPVQVRLLQRDGTILARLTTFLIRLPENPLGASRLRAALVLRLHDRLALRRDGSVDTGRAATSSTRAIVDALRARPAMPVTFAPTPQSLEALRDAKNEGAKVLFGDVIKVSQPPRQVLVTPYVRLDAGAWVTADLKAELTQQQLVGTAVLSSMLPGADRRTWLADADLTPATLGHLRDTGIQQVIVPERSLAALDRTEFPDSLTEPFKVATDAGIPMPAVEIDSRLRSAFSRGSDPSLGANQLLAELAFISFGQKRVPGGVVLAPPDDWRPSPKFLEVLLDGLAPGNPIVTATTVDHLFAQVPPAGSTGPASRRDGADRGFDLVRALTPQPSPSLGGFPGRIDHARTRLTSYASMVGATSPRLTPFGRRLLLSGSADLRTGRRDQLIASVDEDLTRQFNSVVAPSTERVTLTSRNADFPLTLKSRLGYPVNVVIDLQASNRLTFPGGNRIQKQLAGQRTRVKLRVRARVSGDTPVQVMVQSPDGNVVLATSRYTVRVTAVSGVGVVLTSGAALFLVIWWVRHWRTSARQRNDSAPS
ncbi:MAG: DUF6049 family protein [Actinomycetota bacterium]|nr:DUF6049 family protein [Actinomycetota bacterium]